MKLHVVIVVKLGFKLSNISYEYIHFNYLANYIKSFKNVLKTYIISSLYTRIQNLCIL